MLPVFDLGRLQVPPHLDYFAQLDELDDGQLMVKVFHIGEKIGKFVTDEDYDSDLENLSQISEAARKRIDQIIVDDIRGRFEIEASKSELFPDDEFDELIKQTAKAKISGSESDDEFTEPKKLGVPPIFTGDRPASFISMTVPCSGKNIKGSKLIKIVHDRVRNFYDRCIKEGASPRFTEEGGKTTLFLDLPKDWLTTFGGWKDCMPSQEVNNFHFSCGAMFDEVQIFGNTSIFRIANSRIYIPRNFKISATDVTQNWEKVENNWKEKRQEDLTYTQILKTLNSIQSKDSTIAEHQLALLKGNRLNPQNTTHRQCIQFLDYLNALMFGMETSGLNAGLVTSLMVLELIQDEKLTYEEAFKANRFGGVYPFATFAQKKGGNQGTYAARETVLTYRNRKGHSKSMKKFRVDPSLSPVAIKEATLIKYWLKHAGVIRENLSHDEQVQAIEQAIDGLIKKYFFPDEAS